MYLQFILLTSWRYPSPWGHQALSACPIEFQRNTVLLSFGVQADLVWMVKFHIFEDEKQYLCAFINFFFNFFFLDILIVRPLKCPEFRIIRSLYREKSDEMDKTPW